MILKVIPNFTKPFEDTKYPLLGPNLKGLLIFGLLDNDMKSIKYFFRLFHCSCLLFVISQLVELYFTRHDFTKALLNFSMTALSIVSISKTISCLLMQSHLKNQIHAITDIEVDILKNSEIHVLRLMKKYTFYTRVVTNLYWFMVLITNVVTITAPFLKYATAFSYRENVKNGTEPYPQILSSWFPFDNKTMPGYVFASIIHIIMITQGAGVIAVYDTYAVAAMTFLKGHFVILRENCRLIYGDDDAIVSKRDFLKKIKACHRHHTLLLKQYNSFNTFISPVMFIYVLVCSITICCSVVQLNMDNVSNSQKLWVLEFASALAVQLFLYCWHSNEIAIESERVDRGVFESNWWKADLFGRKQLILLSGKLSPSVIMNAGPFTALSIPTFVDIMKGTYSFYTLFTQMQEK